jgi:hypothetical protein
VGLAQEVNYGSSGKREAYEKNICSFFGPFIRFDIRRGPENRGRERRPDRPQ